MLANGIKIRAASLEDAALLSEMGAKAFFQAFAGDNTPEDMAAYLAGAFSPEKQLEELRQPGSTFLIAESEGIFAGYVRLLAGSTETCITGKNPIELVRIYTLQEFIGQGVGSELMRACLEEARGRGHDVIWLGVWQKNPRAIAFYEKWGFEKAGTHTFQLGSDIQHDWIMQRRLG